MWKRIFGCLTENGDFNKGTQMPKYRIIYRDPQTEETVNVIKTFEKEEHISAKAWAEDWAYAVSDKAVYSITEIKGEFKNGR